MEQALRRQGFDFVRANVGDRYVLEALHQRGWLLGGEGLATCWCWTSTPPATASSAPCRCCKPAPSRAAAWPNCWPTCRCFQVLINVRLQSGADWQANARLKSETEAVQAELGAGGRVLIRASGTEPLLRVMVEAADGAQARRCAERLAAAAV